MTNEQWLLIKKIAKNFGAEDGKDRLIKERQEFDNAVIKFEREQTKENLEQVIFEAVDQMVVLYRLVMSYTIMVIGEKKAIKYLMPMFKNGINFKIDRTSDFIDNRYYEGER